MKTINDYIIEKLKLDKDIKISNITNDKINPSDAEASEACKKVTDAKEKISKHIDGYVFSTNIKLIVKDNHFLVRPDDIKDDEEIHETSDIGPVFLHDLVDAKLGHLYIILGYRNSQGVSYNYFFFGKNGEIFNDKKEAKALIDARNSKFWPWDYKKGKHVSIRYKPITIAEATKIPWNRSSVLDSIRFY